MKKIIPLTLLLTIGFTVSGNKLIIEGAYKGHNLYFQLGSCTEGLHTIFISINDTIHDTLKTRSTAFELNLAKYAFPLQTSLKIQLSSDDCFPKLLNQGMDQDMKHPAEFLSIVVSLEDKMIRWSAREDTTKFDYVIEQYRWNRWLKIGSVPSNGKSDMFTASLSLEEWIHSGENKFRIKVCAPFCFYSREIKLEMPETQPDVFANQYQGKPLQFSAVTHYEVYDTYGNVIKSGVGKSVDLKELPRGLYYLAYDNKIAEVSR